MGELRGTFDALAWIRNLPLAASYKSLLYALASRIDDHNECYPGQDTIARDSGMSDRNVRRKLVALEEAGLLYRTARFTGGYKGRTSDIIHVNLGTELAAGHPLRYENESQPDNLSRPTESTLDNLSAGQNDPTNRTDEAPEVSPLSRELSNELPENARAFNRTTETERRERGRAACQRRALVVAEKRWGTDVDQRRVDGLANALWKDHHNLLADLVADGASDVDIDKRLGEADGDQRTDGRGMPVYDDPLDGQSQAQRKRLRPVSEVVAGDGEPDAGPEAVKAALAAGRNSLHPEP